MSAPLRRLLDARTRTVAGVMSGTSADGIDVALARLSGSGPTLRLEALHFACTPFPEAARAAVLAAAEVTTSDVRQLAQLHALLAELYAEAVSEALEAAGLAPEALDLVGCHGQTVQHVPEPEDFADRLVSSTLQLGSGPALAARLGVPVVTDFRAADVALGGQGAPLVPYFDATVLRAPDEARLLLNLGGIANVTVLPPGRGTDGITAFDTGPANMVLDALAQRFFAAPYDRGGAFAAAGTPDEGFLARLLAHPYFHRPPPKSTGREAFGAAFVEDLAARMPERPHDLLATATALTARSVHAAYERFIAPAQPAARVIASGGGVLNPVLMRALQDAFGPVPVETSAAYGIDPDAKEALCFAVLAHEWAEGTPTSLPAVTGARRAALLGSLSLP